MSKSLERAELIVGLRALADALEANASMPLPVVNSRWLVPLTTNAAVEEFAAGRGLTVEYDDEGNAGADVPFGPMTYHVYGYIDFAEHCERRAEKDARQWAERNGLEIRPVDAEQVAR